MPIPAAEAGSSTGLPSHPACYSSLSASGRGPRSGADGGRAGSGASGRLLTATPAAWDGGAPGRGLWHLRSRHSPGRAARAEATRPRTRSLAETGSVACVTPRAPPPPRMTSQPAAWRHAAPGPPRPAAELSSVPPGP